MTTNVARLTANEVAVKHMRAEFATRSTRVSDYAANDHSTNSSGLHDSTLSPAIVYLIHRFAVGEKIRVVYANGILVQLINTTPSNDFGWFQVLHKIPKQHYEFAAFKRELLRDGFVVVTPPIISRPKPVIIGEGDE